MSTLDADVLIVGYGPVGQAMAAMLARRGHRVAAYERFTEIYHLPRAVYFDDEIMQVWQSLGIADELADDVLPASTYNWFGADGELIVTMESRSPGRSRLGAGIHLLPAEPRGRARPGRAGAAVSGGAPWLGRRGAHAGRRPRCGHAAAASRAGTRSPRADAGDENRACSLRGRRGRRELVRAQRLRHRL